ncbi:MAG: AraC family transcriptional regulator [Spirochaetaceae bacterium]|jgi:AraC-like DNA-binding protein|nr:AraC family transcriptional regulator [Spirochaetaceae bacterium]
MIDVDNIDVDNDDVFFIPDIQYLVFRKCPVDWRLKPHSVSNNDITYVVRGRARYTVGPESHEVASGGLLCLSEGVSKAAVTYPDHLMHCYSVNFTLKNTAGEETLLPLPQVSDIGLKDDLVRLFNDLVYARQERLPGSGIKCKALLILLLHRLLELTVYNTNAPGRDYRIQKATSFIARHYAERITVKELADRAGLNAAYFGILFKQVTGLTVNRYIATRRVENAKNLLQSGGWRVTEVAETCGFCDVYHFYKQFKAIMGVPPSRYISNN